MSCAPTYSYRPTFTTRTAPAVPYDPATWVRSPEDCTAPGYPEHRARVTIPGQLMSTDNIFRTALFFRSKGFGPDKNLISVEIPSTGEYAGKFVVRMDGDISKVYDPIIGVGGIGRLRTLITNNTNSIIEMPTLAFDIYDTRTDENDSAGTAAVPAPVLPTDPPAADAVPDHGLSYFTEYHLVGGEGGPSTASGLAAVRTGPERSIVIIVTTEDHPGNTVDVPIDRKTRQWNGSTWISYSNNSPGSCPIEGT